MDPIGELRLALSRLPDSDERRALEETLATAWTTSSEMLGEIGLGIRRIEKAHPVPPEVRAAFERMLVHVHEAWPRL